MSRPSGKETLSELIKTSKMQYPKPTTDDLLVVLSNFSTLKPVLSALPDGTSTKFCLSLTGTIPITYKDQTYHIPIALYFLDSHPYKGPYCFVKPTSSMRIKVSEVVDANGRIFLPYLTEWSYPRYDTMGLLQVMTISFQERCPVFSIVPRGENTAKQKSPEERIVSDPQRQAPMPPHPYPITSSSTGRQHQASSGSVPPVPYPIMENRMMPQPGAPPTVGGAYIGGGATATPVGGYQTPYPQIPSRTSLPGPPAQPSVPYTHSSSNLIGTGYGYGNYGTGTIQPAHIRDSLLSAIQDKIRSRLREQMGTSFAEVQSIRMNYTELRNGNKKLQGMLDEMDKEQKNLESIINIYKCKEDELERVLKDCNSSVDGSDSKELKPEDAVDASTPLHKQIFKCHVQDLAIDDTIYTLGTALKNGTINLQTYLKSVRELSRRQFIHRATLLKARAKAGLPT